MYQRCTIGVTLLLNKTRQSACLIIELQLKKIIKLLIFLVESSLYFNFLNRKKLAEASEGTSNQLLFVCEKFWGGSQEPHWHEYVSPWNSILYLAVMKR